MKNENTTRKDNMLKDKGFDFAVRIVKLSKALQNDARDYSISRQILHSGTAIGALICEAEFAQSKLDFISKMSIALKEANETKYWIRLLQATDYITEKQSESLLDDVNSLIAMLVKSIKTAKDNNK